MRKLLVVLIFAIPVVLFAACSDVDNESGSEEVDEEKSEENKSVVDKEFDEYYDDFYNAKSGDTLEDDFGTYKIKDVVDTDDTFERGDLNISVNKVVIAEFEESDSLEGDLLPEKDSNGIAHYDLAIPLTEMENTGDEKASVYTEFSYSEGKNGVENKAVAKLAKGKESFEGGETHRQITPIRIGDALEEDYSEVELVLLNPVDYEGDEDFMTVKVEL